MLKTVYAHDIATVTKTLDKLVAKANKHGVEFAYEVSGEPYYKKVRVYNTDGRTICNHPSSTYRVEVVDVALSDTLICANGWNVLAHLEHMDGGRNVVTPIAHTGDIPSDWYAMPGNCEHCNSRRKRVKTYIVERNGEHKQVGASCLKDYTGIIPQLAIAWAQVEEIVVNDVMAEGKLTDAFGGVPPKAYTVIEVVALAIDSIAEFGYCKANGMNPTKNRISKMLSDGVSPTTKAKQEAAAVCEYAKDYEGTDDIIQNAKAVISSEYCKVKHFGRLAYLPLAVRKEREREAARAKKAIEGAKSSYIGEVGKRITVELASGNLITSFETQYGTTMVYRFIDTSDNAITWFASKCIDCENIHSITGTIKEHREYNGEKQTIMTRCKIIERERAAIA